MARTIREVSVQEKANPTPIVEKTIRQSAYGPQTKVTKPAKG